MFKLTEARTRRPRRTSCFMGKPQQIGEELLPERKMRSSEPQTLHAYVISTIKSSSLLIAATTPEKDCKEEGAAAARQREWERGTRSLLSQGMLVRSQTRDPLGNASFEARYCHKATHTLRGFAKTSRTSSKWPAAAIVGSFNWRIPGKVFRSVIFMLKI